MSNPYESPQFAGVSLPVGTDRQKLRRVAKYQQWVLYALLSNICLTVGVLTLRGLGFDGFATLTSLFFWPIAIFAMIAVFLLAKELFHVVLAAVFAITMILPCVSLLMLLVVNQKATGFLQQNGVKVGFMGANPDTI